MPKAKKLNRRHNKSYESKNHGKKGKKPRHKSRKLDTQPSYLKTKTSHNPIRNISEYKSYVPITVNSIARARKAQLEAMKGNSSEDDSVDDYHDHNVCIAGGFGLGLDTPIPEYCMKYFDIVEEVHSPHSLKEYESCSNPDSYSSYISPPFSITSTPETTPETTPVREPFPSPMEGELEDHVSNEASHAPSSPFDRELKDPRSNDASHILGGPMTRSKTKKEKQELNP